MKRQIILAALYLTLIKITGLNYSCWRLQSDSKNPVFIKKKKPVFDLQLKLNRCFVNRPGYSNPEFTITYDYFGGDNTKYKLNIDKNIWIKITKGCYKLENFTKVSCITAD